MYEDQLIMRDETIEIIDVMSKQLWDDFVSSHDDATCFHLYGWRKPLEEVLKYETRYFGAMRGSVLVGILPVALVVSKLFGVALVSLPFCSYGGAVSDDPAIIDLLNQTARQFATERFAGYFESRVVGNELSDTKDKTYFTFRKPIPDGPAEMTFMPSKRRNMVRKAVNAGLSWDVSRDVDRFFHLYAENARAHGTPALPKKFFAVLLDELGESADILFVKDKTGHSISCIMSFFDKGVVHAGFAGEVQVARELAANDFKYWSLYQFAKQRDCKTFDLGRSKINTGSFDFKKLWGLSASPISQDFWLISKLEKPSNNPNNPKFALAIKVWAKLPRFVVDRLGPAIIHGLG